MLNYVWKQKSLKMELNEDDLKTRWILICRLFLITYCLFYIFVAYLLCYANILESSTEIYGGLALKLMFKL